MATLRSAYGKLGYRIELVSGSGNRSLLEAAGGQLDGEIARTVLIEREFPDLLRVNVPLLRADAVAYVTRPELVNASKEDLRGLRVGYVKGSRFAERLTIGFPDVWSVESPGLLFSMLENDRLDAVIMLDIVGASILDQRGREGFVKVNTPLERLEFFHYLHKRNVHLVPEIEAALKEMIRKSVDDDDALITPAGAPVSVATN